MLKITSQGWAEIKIGDKVVCEGSYLTEIPLDFLKALYDYFNETDRLNKRYSSSVYVDLEGGVLNFVFSDMHYSLPTEHPCVFLIYQNYQGWKVDTFDIDPYYLAIELIDDVEKDIDKWTEWFADGDTEKEERKNELLYWLDKLKTVMNTQRPFAEKFKAWNTPGTPEYEETERVKKLAIELLEKENQKAYEHIKKHLPEDKNKKGE